MATVRSATPDQVVESEDPSPPPRRRGRPPVSDGLTERRIIEAARMCFAESGYAATTVGTVAARAGLTTGALYHYFKAKHDLFVAVFHEVEEEVYVRFQAVTAKQATFGACIAALFEEMARLHRSDWSLARFMQTVTSDVSRHPELQEAFQVAWPRRDAFYNELVDLGVSTGELAARDRKMVIETITAMMIGLMGFGDLVPAAQARTVEGYKRLVNGMFLQRAPGSG